jgi:DNA modification methylase
VILSGNNLVTLPTVASASAQTCITSPPYFALRDYGVDGQHGLEHHHDCGGWVTGEECGICFVCTQVAVFREVHRILKPDGTLWLNLGDTTASSGGTGVGANAGVGRRLNGVPRAVRTPTMSPKNLLGIPWRVALALQADGWILRQDIIWHKKTPMPETVKDRPTRAHEYLFLLVKQRYYYYDAEAIAEPASADSHARYAQPTPPKGRGGLYRENPEITPRTAERAERAERKAHRVPTGWDTSKGGHRDKVGRYPGGKVKNNPSFDAAMGAAGDIRETRNKRSVSNLGHCQISGARFDAFPESLVKPCILAGSRPGDTVLDPYMGAGTTAVVAERLGRRWIGCELNPEYQAIAEDRIHSTPQGLALA